MIRVGGFSSGRAFFSGSSGLGTHQCMPWCWASVQLGLVGKSLYLVRLIPSVEQGLELAFDRLNRGVGAFREVGGFSWVVG